MLRRACQSGMGCARRALPNPRWRWRRPRKPMAPWRTTGMSAYIGPPSARSPARAPQRNALCAVGYPEHLRRRPAGQGLRHRHGKTAAGNGQGSDLPHLDDEVATINIIVWPALEEKQRAELMNASLLGDGIWQSKSGLRKLIAKRLVDCSHLLGQLDTKSRNFHLRVQFHN